MALASTPSLYHSQHLLNRMHPGLSQSARSCQIAISTLLANMHGQKVIPGQDIHLNHLFTRLATRGAVVGVLIR